MSEVSNDTRAAYIYCPPGKDYDYAQMVDMLYLKTGDSTIAEVYSDGWADEPASLDELIGDLPKYSKVYLLTLEGLTPDHLRILVAGANLKCVLHETEWITSADSHDFRALLAVMEARFYYRQLRSLNIRAGMKKTTKHVGNLPFGHQRLEDGTIQEIPEEMALARSIADMYKAGFPVMEISVKSQGKLTPRQVYGLMNYWGIKRGR